MQKWSKVRRVEYTRVKLVLIREEAEKAYVRLRNRLKYADYETACRL